MAELILSNVAVAIGSKLVVHDVSFNLKPGEFAVLLGANGAGKTTLLRAALGLIPVQSGAVRLDGDNPINLKPEARARKAAYLPQTRPLAWPLLVRDVVALGRFAHGAGIGHLKGADAAAVHRALESCELVDLADRTADTLSGGERARMHIARAFAAEAPLFLADEPIAALDPLHAWRVMDLLAQYAKRGGAALAVIHDPALAAQFASRIIVLRDGRVIADGAPMETLTAGLMAETYGVRADIASVSGGLTVRLSGPA
ncbi:MAG: ABC transporter ATP-binding protein [Caulobacterales bacterium]